MARKPKNVAPSPSGLGAAQGEASVKTASFPREITVTNNTAQRLVFVEVGLELVGNTRVPALGDRNCAPVIVQSEDHAIRFKSEVEMIEKRNGWTNAVTIQGLDDEVEVEDGEGTSGSEVKEDGQTGGVTPPAV